MPKRKKVGFLIANPLHKSWLYGHEIPFYLGPDKFAYLRVMPDFSAEDAKKVTRMIEILFRKNCG